MMTILNFGVLKSPNIKLMKFYVLKKLTVSPLRFPYTMSCNMTVTVVVDIALYSTSSLCWTMITFPKRKQAMNCSPQKKRRNPS